MATTTPSATGLRERKKQQTRARISKVATDLFLERGYEQVTIAEVAAAAGVSKMTVTNYFALKEDLVFDRAEEVAGMASAALARRAAGTPVALALRDAYREALAARTPLLGFIGREFAAMVEASPALRARERAMFDGQEVAIAAGLRDGDDDGEPFRAAFAAAQLSAVFRTLYHEGRRRLLAGETTDETVAALGAFADGAFAAVARALDPA